MSNYTLLLIDYEPRSIERMRRPLEQAGIRVEVATDGVAGLEAFERLQPDAVIVEAMLPKRHGFEVCQEIKKSAHGKRTPVIVTTGVYKGRRYRTQAMHIHGADEYLEKPLTDEQIVETVRRLLAGRPERPASSPAPTPTPPAAATRPASPAPSRPPAPMPLDADASDLFEIIDESLSRPKSADAAPRPAPRPAPPKPPAPTTARSTSAVGDLTEDEIIARLDALLPSDPAVSTEVSWESGHAVGHLEAQTEPHDRSIAVADDPAVEPIRDVAAEILADFPPMPEIGDLPEDLQVDDRDVDLAPPTVDEVFAPPPRPEAQVFAFDAGRNARRKSPGAKDAPSPVGAVAERSHGSSAVAPVVAIPQAGGLVEAPAVEIPLTESYETPKRGLPIWVWVVATAGLAAGAYFAFFRTAPSPSPLETNPVTATAPVNVPAPAATEPVSEPPAPASDPAQGAPKTDAPIAAAARPQPAPRPQDPPPAPSAILAWVPAKPGASAGASNPASPLPAAPAPAPPVADAVEDPSLTVAPVTPAVDVSGPAKPALRAGDLVSLNEVDSPPIGLDKPSPQYTSLGRTRRQEGTVVFEVLVDETGRVADVRLIRGIAGSDLNDAAMNAARSWVYKPAEKNGVAVRVWRPEQVRFKL